MPVTFNQDGSIVVFNRNDQCVGMGEYLDQKFVLIEEGEVKNFANAVQAFSYLNTKYRTAA
jgi:hypothetical protein